MTFKSDTLDPTKPIQIARKIWWVGHLLPNDRFQCHVYLIENGDQSVLIDPGSKLTFKYTLQKIEQIIPFGSIRYFICHHQDPDITGSLYLIDQLISRSDAMVLSHWRAIAILKHLGLQLPLVCVEENQWHLNLKDRELEFIFTPYLHFPGAFCTFDKKEHILFSSDLFGGFTDSWELYAKDESYFESIRAFHEHYMPSREILTHFLNKIEKYPLRLIAPQHGSIVPEDLIDFMITQLKNIDCGIYLMTQTSTDVMHLSKLNQILKSFMASMVIYKNFREVADECLKQIKQILPADRLQFFAKTQDNGIIQLNFKPPSDEGRVELPEDIKEMFGKDRKQFEKAFGCTLCKSELNNLENDDSPENPINILTIPLIAPGSGNIHAFAVLHLIKEVSLDDETKETLLQISLPLSVAVEREIIYRSLESERQKFYEQSIHDPLTNLYTRIYMRESVKRLFSIHDRDPKSAVGIIALDIDHFKKVNDTFGHNAGDQVLKAVSAIIFDETRSGDIQVRMGGEEFSIFTVCYDIDLIKTIAERIRLKVQELRFEGAMTGHRFSISAGVIMRNQKESIDDAMHRADIALYEAKNTGRNKVVIQV